MYKTFSFPDEEVTDAEIVRILGLTNPPGIGVELKAPQQLARHFGANHKKFILSFDKGMGKTLTYLLVAEETPDVDKVIILCTKNAMSAQRKAFRKHFPHLLDSFTFVLGQPGQRQQAWAKDVKYYICTYAGFLADMGLRQKSGARIAPAWVARAMIVCDEYHRVLRNRKSGPKKPNATFEMLKRLNPPRLIFSSGSAANKGPHSMWAALHLCDRHFFSSYWNYVNAYCIVEDTPFGKKITGVRNVAAWRRTIAPYVIHRKKDLKDYPPKSRQALEVEMEPWQKKIHDQLKRELMAEIEQVDGTLSFIVALNTLAAAVKIRQFLVCPKFLDPALPYGAGLDAILEDVTESELSHWVISTPFRGPLPLLRQFFSEAGYHTEVLCGGMGPDEVDSAIERWTRNGGPIIQTIEFAESYELPAARIMYMLGSAYDPERNSQAEDRIHRDIHVTPDPVDIYYIKHMGSYEEKIFDDMSMHADIVFDSMNRPLSQVHELFGEA